MPRSNSSSNGSRSDVANAKRSVSNRASRSSRGRSRSSRSSGIAALPGTINRSVITPVTRSISRSRWMPWALGAVGLGALIYGLSRIRYVRDLAAPIGDTISSTFGRSSMEADIEDSFGFEEDARVLSNDFNTGTRGI